MDLAERQRRIVDVRQRFADGSGLFLAPEIEALLAEVDSLVAEVMYLRREKKKADAFVCANAFALGEALALAEKHLRPKEPEEDESIEP